MAACGSDAPPRAAAPAVTHRPNIVFILADDLGYGDLGAYGQADYATPRIDRLATQGVRLTQAYASSAVCSPSRVALLTGRYQYRLRVGLEEPIAGPSDTLGLPPEQPTLPALLKRAGYRTALFGKWHLGNLPNFGPLKSGYDEFFGNYGGGVDYFTHRPDVGPGVPEDLYEGSVPVHRTGYYTRLLGDRAVDYIRHAAQNQPFFLSLHFTAPHWPWEGPGDEAVSRSLTDIMHHDGGSPAVYASMVMELDTQVGRVLDALEQAGLAQDTIVVFTSDNGGERYSRMWPYTGQKTELLEGGLRVPAIIRWPDRLPAGALNAQVSTNMDWLPTLLAAAGATADAAQAPDGVDLLPILRGERPRSERTLYWRYKANGQRAVRSGAWKYLRINDSEFLFDVEADPRERANLSGRHPDVLADLRQRWEAWNAQMLPAPKEAYSHSIAPGEQADHYTSAPRD